MWSFKMSNDSLRTGRQLSRLFGGNETIMDRGHGTKKDRHILGRHDKRIPPWTMSDFSVLNVLCRSFPKWKTSPRQRSGMARWHFIIERYYRMNWSRFYIAQELRLTDNQLKATIRSIKRAGEGLNTVGKVRKQTGSGNRSKMTVLSKPTKPRGTRTKAGNLTAKKRQRMERWMEKILPRHKVVSRLV
jgi:hypothetical protein